MWYMILGLNLKLFWYHKPLIHVLKNNLKLSLESKFEVMYEGMGWTIRSSDWTTIGIVD